MVMRCRHSQDRASTPSALRKIKPQRAQRITESCYFYLSPPLCPLWFSKTLFRKYQKVSGVLVITTRDTKDPTKFLTLGGGGGAGILSLLEWVLSFSMNGGDEVNGWMGLGICS